LVKRNDPAFKNPSKPIGSFMDEAAARKFETEGWQVLEDAGRGWRRVVASPKPLRIIEEDAISRLLQSGSIVIAVGGGGIPVVHHPSGELRELSGVYAVIDKDRASAILARQLQVDLFLISTGVEKVAIHFNTPEQQDLDNITASQLRKYLDEGHFAPGSMKPKVEAVLSYLDNGGKAALITNPENIARALNRETGTWIESG
jgi:carbamate kinase